MNLEEAYLDYVARGLVIQEAPVEVAQATEASRVGRSRAPGPQSIGEAASSLGSGVKGMVENIAAPAAKGAAQGFVGLPGDIEGIARTLINVAGGKVSEETVLATTEEIKKFLDGMGLKVGGGDSAAETVGEFMAPGGYVKGAKKAVKKVKEVVSKAKKEAK